MAKRLSVSVIKSSAQLRKLFIEKLKQSGLGTREAKLLGMRPLMSKEMAKLKVPPYAGFKIPYFDVKGKLTKFYRVRYLEPTLRGFEKDTDKKGMKYGQPPGTGNDLYFPPLIDWQVVLKTDKPLVITEGELKAACAARLGIPCIGIGGVWCFRSSTNKQTLLPAFEHLNLTRRPIYIAFDSDSVLNPNVTQAENVLCRELTGAGALPHLIRLPDLLDDGKTGLDDFLMAKGMGAFAKLLTDADVFKTAEELYKLNEEVLLIRDPGLIYEHSTSTRMSVKTFQDAVYANRIIVEEIVTKNGTRLEKKNAAREWVKWKDRAEVNKAVYRPGVPMITPDRCLNTWKGWGLTPKPGSVKPWKDLLDFLFAGDAESRRWFEQWCAYPLQHPGTKMFTSAVIWGTATGTGKTMVGYTLMTIYGENGIEIEDEDLERADNDYAENKQFAMGDDITGGDKRGIADRLKRMITRKTVRINVKYVPRYSVEDCINYYFTSNHPDAFFLEDADRRFFIHEVKGSPRPKSFYDGYNAWLTSGGGRCLFHYLLNLDLAGFDPRAPAPVTSSKTEMIETGRSDLGLWIAGLREDPDGTLRVSGKTISYKLWRPEELLALYDPDGHKRVTVNGLARELKRAGFRKACGGIPIRVNGKQCRLWIMRGNEDGKLEKQSYAKIAEIYESERSLIKKERKFKA